MIEAGETRPAKGRETGLEIPADPAALEAGGAAFLTDALRAGDLLAPGECVAAVETFATFAGGNSGAKAMLDVRYDPPRPDLPTRLFAKFSRDFADPFRDRRRFELDAEVRLATLSRHPRFPVAVPQTVFADFDPVSGTGLLLTERIAFGESPIEPLHEKCMDHLLADPLEHYRALMTAHARLAAAQRQGVLSPELEMLFPYDRAAAEADLPIAYDAAALAEKIEGWRELVSEAPGAFPASLCAPGALERLREDAEGFLANEPAVRRFLQADPDFVALTHWNTNIDNAWFWRDDDGALQCGLLDWGMVRQMNIATGLWGGLSAGSHDFLVTHLEGLLDHYRGELAAHGGPVLDREDLTLHFDLALAITGLALLMDIYRVIRERTPRLSEARAPVDPVFSEGAAVQGFVVVAGNFLSLWLHRDLGASLRKMLASSGQA